MTESTDGNETDVEVVPARNRADFLSNNAMSLGQHDYRYSDLLTHSQIPGLLLRFPKNLAQLKKGSGFLAVPYDELEDVEFAGWAGPRARRILSTQEILWSSATFPQNSWYSHTNPIYAPTRQSAWPRAANGSSTIQEKLGFEITEDEDLVLATGALVDYHSEPQTYVLLEIIAPGVKDGKFFRHKHWKHHSKSFSAVNTNMNLPCGYLTTDTPITTVEGVLRTGAKYIYDQYTGKALTAMQYGVGTVLQSSYAKTAVNCSFMTAWSWDSERLTAKAEFGVSTPQIDFLVYRDAAEIPGVIKADAKQYGVNTDWIGVAAPDSDAFISYAVIPVSGMLPREEFIASIASAHRLAESTDPVTRKLVGIVPIGLDLGTAAQLAAQRQMAISESAVDDFELPEYKADMSQKEKDAFEYSYPNASDIVAGQDTHMTNYSTHTARNALFRDLSAVEARVCSVAESAVRRGMFR